MKVNLLALLFSGQNILYLGIVWMWSKQILTDRRWEANIFKGFSCKLTCRLHQLLQMSHFPVVRRQTLDVRLNWNNLLLFLGARRWSSQGSPASRIQWQPEARVCTSSKLLPCLAFRHKVRRTQIACEIFTYSSILVVLNKEWKPSFADTYGTQKSSPQLATKLLFVSLPTTMAITAHTAVLGLTWSD